MIIDELVKELQSLKGGRPLGFCDPPTAKRIYMNRQYSDALWYFWNGAKNLHEPIADHGIWGIVLGVAIADKMFKGKPDPKLQVKVKADRLYILECGIDTVTARGLIFGLAAIDDFSLPIMITVKAGDDDNVLLCNVYDNDDNRMYTPTDEDTNYSELLQQIQSRLDGNTSIEPMPEPVAAQAPVTQKPTPRPVVSAPVEPVVESDEEEEIEYEFTVEDEQPELIPGKSVDELSLEIKAMSIATAPDVLAEINRHEAHLGVNHGGVIARYNKQLTELKDLAEQALTRSKAVGMSGAEAKAKLGGARDTRTLAQLKAFVEAIVLPPAEPVDLAELPF